MHVHCLILPSEISAPGDQEWAWPWSTETSLEPEFLTHGIASPTMCWRNEGIKLQWPHDVFLDKTSLANFCHSHFSEYSLHSSSLPHHREFVHQSSLPWWLYSTTESFAALFYQTWLSPHSLFAVTSCTWILFHQLREEVPHGEGLCLWPKNREGGEGLWEDTEVSVQDTRLYIPIVDAGRNVHRAFYVYGSDIRREIWTEIVCLWYTSICSVWIRSWVYKLT